jgi:hypothetical protein
VSGTFVDKSTNTDPHGDLRFDGVGQVTLRGATGSVVGSADFRFVTAPAEVSLTFSSISSCTIT